MSIWYFLGMMVTYLPVFAMFIDRTLSVILGLLIYGGVFVFLGMKSLNLLPF